MASKTAADPYATSDEEQTPSMLDTLRPAGGELTLNADGSADVMMEGDEDALEGKHFDNLALTLDATRLSAIATDLLDAIEVDKEARKKRDQQYELGLKRTGLGDDAPGGAPFNGSSRVVHPMLLEAALDFSARSMSELLPPTGPAKEYVFGENTNDKQERAKRTARYMNYQITDLMGSAYHEFEIGLTQAPLGGAFYTKMYEDNGTPAVMFCPIDKVHRPWSDGDFYSQPRITHEQEIDKFEFKNNVRRGLWADVVDPESASDLMDETLAERANDRIIGRDQPTEDVDAMRQITETSVLMTLMDEDDEEILPYLVTIDVQTRKVLAIYRNWEENDANKKRLDFLIEWAFWPWRGGYPIGMSHMIGGLSGAATGAVRALLDAAYLNTVQTGVHLKGGATAGGQNIRPQIGQTVEVQGSLAQDDIRKTYMPLEFPQPSPVLFQLLGFLVDGARGVIRTTFDEPDNIGGNTPVGTAQTFVEQGLKNLGSIHARLHRSMKRFLKQLWDINAKTVENEEVIDAFGELVVTREDFTGPMTVVPVSDPRIFSDMQRSMLGQLVASRATAAAGSTNPQVQSLYKMASVEMYFLRQHNVPQPEQFLNVPPEPKQTNAVAENVLASDGMPIKAFMGQDHEAHIATHVAYIQSKLFGSNPVIAGKLLPIMLGHLADHLSKWYASAVMIAANAAIEAKAGKGVTVESLASSGTEVELDRMLAELQPDIMKHAETELSDVPAIILQAQQLLKSMAPPQPMDPSIVAKADVDRQAQADQANAQQKQAEGAQKGQLAQATLQQKDQESQRAAELEQVKIAQDAKDKAAEVERQRQADEQSHVVELAKVALGHTENDTNEKIADDTNATNEKIAEGDNETALEISDDKIEAGAKTKLSDGASLGKS